MARYVRCLGLPNVPGSDVLTVEQVGLLLAAPPVDPVRFVRVTGTVGRTGTHLRSIQQLAADLNSPPSPSYCIVMADGIPGFATSYAVTLQQFSAMVGTLSWPSTLPAPIALWSTTKLLPAYSGPVATNAAGVDIAFVNGEMPVPVNTTVSNFYDQSGNGYHLSQSNAALRPLLRTDAAINGRNPVVFDGFSTGTAVVRSLVIPSSLGVETKDCSIWFWGRQGNSGEQSTWIALANFSETADLMALRSAQALLVSGAAGARTFSRYAPVTPSLIGVNSSASSCDWYAADRSSTGTALATGGVCVGGLIGTSFTTLRNGRFELLGMAILPVLTTQQISDLQTFIRGITGAPAAYNNAILYDGNSITAGTGSLYCRNITYYAQRYLTAGKSVKIYNGAAAGLLLGGGSGIVDGATLAARFAPAAGETATRKIAFMNAATNDLAAGRTAVQLQADILTWITAARGAGFLAWVSSVLPRKNFVTITIAGGGTGYVLNEVVTLANGATARASAVSGGVITSVALLTHQTSQPANPVAQVSTTGVGIGATFNFDYAKENERSAYNTWMRTNAATAADGFSDRAADPIMGPIDACLNTALLGDGIHPTNQGYDYLAQCDVASFNPVLI